MAWWNLWSKDKTRETKLESDGDDLPPDSDYGSDYNGMPSPEQEAQTLSDIIRGIAHAASATNEIQDQQFIKQIDHYFHKEDDGTLVAKVVRAKIDDGNYIEVPLISMIDPSTLGLEEMTVRMGIRLSKSKVKQAVDDAKNAKVSRASFNVSLTGCKPGERQDVMDVTMVFKKTEPSEGASQLVENMNGMIQPKKYDGSTKKPNLSTNIFTSKIARTQSLEKDSEIDHDNISTEVENTNTNPLLRNEVEDFEPQDLPDDEEENEDSP